MIEEIVINYLSQVLDIPVSGEEPIKKPKEYIVIEKTGSSELNQIKSATIVVQSYSDSLINAAKLNEEVKEEMKSIVILNQIARCKLNSDYNFTDIATKRYRYQAVFDIKYY